MATKGESTVGAESGVPKAGREALSPPTVMTGTGGVGGNSSMGTRMGSRPITSSGAVEGSSSMRRVAPVVVTSSGSPGPATAASSTSRPSFTSSSSASSDCILAPSVVQRLGREMQDLVRSPPEGITFVPNELDSLAEVHADISGPVGTPYEGGVFRMKLVLSRDYPASPPRAYFLTKIFHPNIASNGDICVNMLKRDWSPDLKLCDSLMVIRCLLIVPFPESSLNDEAAKLFMESYDEYARRARLMTRVHAWAHHSAAGGGKVGASASPKAGASPKGKNAATSDENGAPATNSTTSSKTGSQQRDKNKETRKKGLKRL